MTATIGDCNGDLIPDILVSRLGYGSLYVGSTNKVFSDQMLTSGLGALTAQYVGWGSNFLDFDNDGDLDVFIANGDAHHLVGWESLLLENSGDGHFTDAAVKGGAFFRTKIRARGSVILDYDNDGRIDILVTTMGDRPFLLHNRAQSGNHWLTLDLQGTKSNRDGFGRKDRRPRREQGARDASAVPLRFPRPIGPAGALGLRAEHDGGATRDSMAQRSSPEAGEPSRRSGAEDQGAMRLFGRHSARRIAVFIALAALGSLASCSVKIPRTRWS